MAKHNRSSKELYAVMTSRNVKRKRRRRTRGIALLICLALCAGIVLFGMNAYVVKRTAGRILTPQELAAAETYDCILVLGARVMPGEVPSHMLEDRCRRGVELYQAKAAPVLLMSGDHGQDEYDEVSVMKQYAVDAGVSSSDVFMDHAGFSTYDSIYRARDVFQAKRILIVTQEYHMPRALYIAQQLGLEADGVTCDYRSYATQARNSLREYLARLKDVVKCFFRPKPTYLGEVIPLDYDGDITNDKGVTFTPKTEDME